MTEADDRTEIAPPRDGVADPTPGDDAVMHLETSAHSEIGLVRKNNQDSGYVSDSMIVVADGMGGAAAGDLASAVAISQLADADRPVVGDEMLTLLSDAVTRANEMLAALVHNDRSLDGMGTTVCGAAFDGHQLGLVHIGDSRGYVFRDEQLTRLTHDHSWVQSLVDEGKLTEEQALYHPHRSLLLKVLNGQSVNAPDLSLYPVQPGDRLMFCSDGLCGLVEDTTIGEVLANPDREECLADLIQAAHDGGGLDNITIIVADVVAGPAAAAAVPLTLGAASEVEVPAIDPIPVPEHNDEADEPTIIRPPVAAMPATGQPTPTPTTPASPTAPRAAAGASAVVDPEDQRYRPRKPPRGRRLVLLLVIVVVVLAVLGAGLIGYQALTSRYYVGNANGKVAIYQGAPDNLGPLRVQNLTETSPTNVTDLPPRYQEYVRGNTYRDLSLAGARTTVQELDAKARSCVAQREQRARATTTPTPSPTPTSTQTIGPPATATPSTASPGPTPTSPTDSPTGSPLPPAGSVTPTPPPAAEEC